MCALVKARAEEDAGEDDRAEVEELFAEEDGSRGGGGAEGTFADFLTTPPAPLEKQRMSTNRNSSVGVADHTTVSAGDPNGGRVRF